MSLPTSMSTSNLLARYGVRFVAYPSSPEFGIEWQFSTAAGAPTSKWDRLRLPPSPGNVVVQTREVPFSTKAIFARARHWRLGYADGPFSATTSGVPQRLVDIMPTPAGTGASDSWTAQASIIPNPNTLTSGSNLTYDSGGATTGHMWLSWAWLSSTMYRPDGTSFTITGSGGIPPITPSLSQVAGGALGARTRWVRIALVKDHMFYMQAGNSETSLAINANNLLVVASPASKPGFDGWAVLVGSASNAEFTQPTPTTALPFGTAWTEPVGGATVAGTTPWNAKWGGDAAHNAITAVELTAISTYYFYPCFDTHLMSSTTLGLLRMACAIGTGPATNTDAPSAQLSVSDGVYAVTLGAVTAATPAGGSAGSGTATGQTNNSATKYL